jgi:hypothetical protein
VSAVTEPQVVHVTDSDECRAEEGIAHLHAAVHDLPQWPATPPPPGVTGANSQ